MHDGTDRHRAKLYFTLSFDGISYVAYYYVVIEDVHISCIIYLDNIFLEDLATCIEIPDHLGDAGCATLEAHSRRSLELKRPDISV
jgi:hypothetical protein